MRGITCAKRSRLILTLTHLKMIPYVAALATILLPATFAVEPEIWRHGWKNMEEMLYMHGGNTTIISDDATVFAAKHYPIVAFSNCYGHGDGTLQEDAALISARALRKVNPDVKNVFYWKVDLDSQVKGCSTAKTIWKDHPEWLLANVTNNKGYYDFTNPAVRTFWKNHVLSLAYEMDETNGTPLFNGFYMDGWKEGNATAIPTDSETQHEWGIDQREMVKELQIELDYLGMNQLLVINGMDTVESALSQSKASPASMVDHFAILQFLNRKTGEWLYEPMKELLFNVIRSPLAANRTLLIKAWPGPIVKQRDIMPNHTTPDSPEEFRKEALEYLNAALALFLLVAEDTIWFSYSWFWRASDYVPYGPDHTCPDDFYPTFQCPLGEPLGPPMDAEGGGAYEYRREYEHVSVYVDLKDRNATRVVWKSGDPKNCPGAPSKTKMQNVGSKTRDEDGITDAPKEGNSDILVPDTHSKDASYETLLKDLDKLQDKMRGVNGKTLDVKVA